MSNTPKIVFMDMDYTVLENDCDVLWKDFLADEGISPDSAREKARYYLNLHHLGELPVDEYVQFQMHEFTGHTPEVMHAHANRHFEKYVKKYIYPSAVEEIKALRARDVPVVLLTGTNRVIATPISSYLGTELIATELEVRHGKYTGDIAGLFLIRENKVKMAFDYCEKHNTTIGDCAFYGDSINDAQLLGEVAQATVVNPTGKLLDQAESKGWRIVRWSLG